MSAVPSRAPLTFAIRERQSRSLVMGVRGAVEPRREGYAAAL
jgi:hypothetical protein